MIAEGPQECSSNRSLSADDAAGLLRSRNGGDCGIRVFCAEVAAPTKLSGGRGIGTGFDIP